MKPMVVNGVSDEERTLKQFALSCIHDHYLGCRRWPHDRRDADGKHVRQRVTTGEKYANGLPKRAFMKAFVCEGVHGPNPSSYMQAGSACGDMSCYSKHCVKWMPMEEKARLYNEYRHMKGDLPPTGSSKFSEKYRSASATETPT